MLELESYKVSGFRALADTERIPVRSPTILTGGNDGGKTTAIDALRFLLGGPTPVNEDYTQFGRVGATGAEPLSADMIVVQGTFTPDSTLREAVGLGTTIEIRRIARPNDPPRYEMLTSVPESMDLRSLGSLKLDELKKIAADRGVAATGSANAKASWIEPLEVLADSEQQVEDWISLASDISGHLPRCLVFSSTAEPDPEKQIHEALRGAFDQILDDTTYTGPVRKAETEVRDRLTEEAKRLCEHIADQCPELSNISVVPDVAFKEGFRGVIVRASRGELTDISLDKSGAGRKRRINLAVWEWVEQLLEREPDENRGVVIAYDEPDTHLDYGHQRELVNLIQRQCSRDATRMVVATHSLNLIDRVSISDVVHLHLEDDHTTVERLVGEEHEQTQQYLAEVSAAMGLRNSVLLHERCFVGVEGATETQAFPLLFRVATGLSLQSAGIALIAGNSNEGALRVARFLKEHDRKLAFVVDADSKTGSVSKLFREEKLNSIGILPSQVHYVGSAELEDLFSLEQWATAANVNWPRDDKREWTAQDLAPVPLGSKFSDALRNVIRGGSGVAPRRKPGYMVGLAQTLTESSEVPAQLREVFADLTKLANEPLGCEHSRPSLGPHKGPNGHVQQVADHADFSASRFAL